MTLYVHPENRHDFLALVQAVTLRQVIAQESVFGLEEVLACMQEAHERAYDLGDESGERREKRFPRGEGG